MDNGQGTDGLTVQVDYPLLGGTQTIQLTLPNQTTPIALTPNAQATIGPGGVQIQVLTGLAGTLILQVNGSASDPSVVIPAGDYLDRLGQFGAVRPVGGRRSHRCSTSSRRRSPS